MRDRRVAALALPLALALLGPAAPGASAQEEGAVGPADASASEVKGLRRELRALRERVEELAPLEERVRELEAKLAEQEEAAVADAVPAKPGVPDAAAEEDPFELDLGGALRFNYAYRDFTESSRSKGGDLEFDLFRIDVDAEYGDLLASAQYRWYDYQEVLHHGWVGYRFTESVEARAGVTQVPFGILPYASHSWWFGVPYYLGFEDDYDMGGTLEYESALWELHLGLFKNAEYGNAGRSERYSFDLVTDASRGQTNEETNQLNARAVRTFEHGPEMRTELGVSGEWGQIYNATTDDMGTRWAAGAHVDGHYGPWNAQLQAFHYEFAPENPPGVPDESVLLGAFATTYLAPAEGTVLVANLAREFAVDLGPIDGLTCYNDYSTLLPDDSGLDEFQINTTGCMVSAGPVASYVDFIAGSGAPFLGVPPEDLFSPISGDAWNLRLNVNVGYYF